MAAKLFKRYVWLINTIIQSGSITYEAISAKWEHSALNDKRTPLPKRTFIRHKEEVNELLGIDIIFRKRDNTYSIANIEDIQSDGQKDWVLNSFAVLNMLQESYQFKDRLIFEKVPSGTEFLTSILEAIKTSRKISFDYLKFGATEKDRKVGAPYSLKIDKQRWYVLLCEGHTLKTYSLDRISDLDITEEPFRMPADFSAWDFFNDSYGIWVDTKKSAEKVRIKAFGLQVHYLRTLPLHHSQRETIVDENCSIFEYHIKVDVEFTAELFKLGANIQVMEPQSLVEEIKRKANEMLAHYEKQ